MQHPTLTLFLSLPSVLAPTLGSAGDHGHANHETIRARPGRPRRACSPRTRASAAGRRWLAAVGGVVLLVACDVEEVEEVEDLDVLELRLGGHPPGSGKGGLDPEVPDPEVPDPIPSECSLSGYPAPPTWEGPGPHCDPDLATNPGCPEGLDGLCEIPDSGWSGPYDIYVDNCHDAANCGVEAGTCAGVTTGILSCVGNTEGMGGHTVNYSVVPGTGEHEGDFVVCLSEPQHPDPNATKCCWVQDDDTPDTAVGQPGHACYAYRCGSQAQDGGGTPLPAGECWPTPSSDPPCGTTWDKGAMQCCQEYAARWDHALREWCSQGGYEAQVQFRCDEYGACAAAAGAPGA